MEAMQLCSKILQASLTHLIVGFHVHLPCTCFLRCCLRLRRVRIQYQRAELYSLLVLPKLAQGLLQNHQGLQRKLELRIHAREEPHRLART